MKENCYKSAICIAAVCASALVLRAAEIGPGSLISHRGESVDAPENTLPAYKTAVDRGFGFECDIYLSKDKRVFTFHDENFKRTTGGANTNRCCDASWEYEVSKIDVGNWGKWKGSRFAGTRPALLEEVLDLAVDGRWIYIEIKPGPEIVPYIKEVFSRQKKATPKNTLFISFNVQSCRAVKELMPEYKVYWLSNNRKERKADSPPKTSEDIIKVLKEAGVDGVDIKYDPSIITDDFIKAVRMAGFECHVWTVDSLDHAMEAFRRGAQTVTTNCAKALLDEYLARCGSERAK